MAKGLLKVEDCSVGNGLAKIEDYTVRTGIYLVKIED